MKNITNLLNKHKYTIDKDDAYFDSVLKKIKYKANQNNVSNVYKLKPNLFTNKKFVYIFSSLSTACVLLLFLILQFKSTKITNNINLSYETACILYENNYDLVSSAKKGSTTAKYQLYNKIYSWIVQDDSFNNMLNSEDSDNYTDTSLDETIISDNTTIKNDINKRALLYTEFLINGV